MSNRKYGGLLMMGLGIAAGLLAAAAHGLGISGLVLAVLGIFLFLLGLFVAF